MPPTVPTSRSMAYLKTASAHPQGHLSGARISSGLLRRLLQARYFYRNDQDGFVMDVEEALASSGDQPLIITLAGRRAALTTAQLTALTNGVGPDGRLAPSVPWPTTHALAALGLTEFRDQQGSPQLHNGDDGVSGRTHHAFRTPLGQLVAELNENDDRA
ncbi:hypothetical protein [Streptomyces aureoversilis]|uniref:Uncharacterized protein n=1 Tax=Streptomyces aureoversilis TaxID=67277 RepID=A0ABW0A5J1_9ACTN